MGFEDDILARIEAGVARYGSQKKLSDVTGISTSSLSRWLKHEVLPSIREVAPLMDLLEPETVQVPFVAARPGAGSSLLTSAEKKSLYPFPVDFLINNGISRKSTVVMQVMGDSMAPLLHDSDNILVDESKRDIISGKIFVIGLGEELLVKRLLRGYRELIIHSQNSDYPDIHLREDEIQDLRIYGRVVWYGRLI